MELTTFLTQLVSILIESEFVKLVNGKDLFQFLGASSQNVHFCGCDIFFLPSGYPINLFFHW